jgi:hypothetical protein
MSFGPGWFLPFCSLGSSEKLLRPWPLNIARVPRAKSKLIGRM